MITPSLSLIIERGRAIVRGAVNKVIKDTKLPAYLIEGILLDVLAEVRDQKNSELAAELEQRLAKVAELEQLLKEKAKESDKDTSSVDDKQSERRSCDEREA